MCASQEYFLSQYLALIDACIQKTDFFDIYSSRKFKGTVSLLRRGQLCSRRLGTEERKRDLPIVPSALAFIFLLNTRASMEERVVGWCRSACLITSLISPLLVACGRTQSKKRAIERGLAINDGSLGRTESNCICFVS